MCSAKTLYVFRASENALNFLFFCASEGAIGLRHSTVRDSVFFILSAQMFLLRVKNDSCVLAESCASLEPKRPTTGVCQGMQTEA